MTYEDVVDSWNKYCIGTDRYNSLIADGFVLNEPIDLAPLPDDFYMGSGCHVVRGSFVLPNGVTKYWGIPNNPKANLPFDTDTWDNCLKEMAIAWKLEMK